MNLDRLPQSWLDSFANQTSQPYWHQLQDFIQTQRETSIVYPPVGQIFRAFELTAPQDVHVVVLGQDPYHSHGQANGLCFSVPGGVKIPPSLRNIYKELHTDLGITPATSGDLSSWARQGVLLLNATLTVSQDGAGTHQGYGWETFTDAVVRTLGTSGSPIVFVLWGAFARRKKILITHPQHTIIESVHPSPLSAHNGFFGSRPFSQINDALIRNASSPLDWRIQDN
ncbi:MAG: uracil-DNA glycosylase [Actinobacteria bacterium]|nr:MAG: uracil-DNA glycosylase [Actinomycetota bacterium]